MILILQTEFYYPQYICTEGTDLSLLRINSYKEILQPDHQIYFRIFWQFFNQRCDLYANSRNFFFPLIFTVLFISLCDKYCKSCRGDFPRVRSIGFQQFLLLVFFYCFCLFILFFRANGRCDSIYREILSLLQLYKLENNILGYDNAHFKDWLIGKFCFSQWKTQQKTVCISAMLN